MSNESDTVNDNINDGDGDENVNDNNINLENINLDSNFKHNCKYLSTNIITHNNANNIIKLR